MATRHAHRPHPVNTTNPLRLIVDDYYPVGEPITLGNGLTYQPFRCLLECGHLIGQSSDIYGAQPNRQRRRCTKCGRGDARQVPENEMPGTKTPAHPGSQYDNAHVGLKDDGTPCCDGVGPFDGRHTVAGPWKAR